MKKFVPIALMLTTLLPSIALANYHLRITEPAEDRSYMRPAQTVAVALTVTPRLADTDRLTLSIDGEVVAENALSYEFASYDYYPGEHVLRAEIFDINGHSLAQDTRRIYLVQNSAIILEKRAAAKAQAEYDALPWYKKIGLKMRKKD